MSRFVLVSRAFLFALLWLKLKPKRWGTVLLVTSLVAAPIKARADNTDPGDSTGHSDQKLRILFQNGPILEVGVNGISGEALLAIVIDRLRSFQAGQYACRENALALTKLEESLMWLNKRTADRKGRGVEGKHVK